MKKLTSLFISVVGAVLLFATQANAVTYWASSIYADPGVRTDGNDMQAGRDNPSNALGAPDGDFWSMGNGGIAVLEFIPPTSFNQAVMTIEETYGCTSINQSGNCSNYTENANIYLYSSAIDFSLYSPTTFGPNSETVYDFSTLLADLGLITPLATIGNGDASAGVGGHTLDISGLGQQFLYVILEDISSTSDGFDIVSVSVSTVPLPAALPLYGAGMAVMGFIGWRKRRKMAA